MAWCRGARLGSRNSRSVGEGSGANDRWRWSHAALPDGSRRRKNRDQRQQGLGRHRRHGDGRGQDGRDSQARQAHGRGGEGRPDGGRAQRRRSRWRRPRAVRGRAQGHDGDDRGCRRRSEDHGQAEQDGRLRVVEEGDPRPPHRQRTPAARRRRRRRPRPRRRSSLSRSRRAPARSRRRTRLRYCGA